MELKTELKKNFGFDQFRGEQEEIVQSVLKGQDTLVIMPTGGGKSLCYQLPALISEGTAIVISPLIALMKNQVDHIRSLQDNESVAHVLNSTLSQKQVKEVKTDIEQGICKLVYVAPETLVKEDTIEFFSKNNISFIAIDEAHCISEWGHDFRPEYRKIKETVNNIKPEIPLIALTATATPKVQQDIVKSLGMEQPNTYLSSFLRDNLFYEIREKGSKEQVVKQLVQFVQQRKGQSGVVYALNRKTTEEIADLLAANGINAVAYHAGLEKGLRNNVQDGFLMDNYDVICATIAFGMGIDKPDVRYVIHYDIPKSLENYYQETGRAGRDGIQSHCLAFFSHKDINKLEKFLKDKPVAEKEIAGQHITEMVAYSETSGCRRQFLLHYFGETYNVPEEGCKHCDNCNNPKEQIDVSANAHLALETVQKLQEKHTITYLVDFITGRGTQQIKLYKHDQDSLFGVGSSQNKNYWNSIYRNLLIEDLLSKDIETYGVIKMTPKGKDFLKNKSALRISLFNDFKGEGGSGDLVPTTVALDEELQKKLMDLRKKVAMKHKLPPAIIFLENSINDMATQYPITEEEMANIVGVSIGKAKKYGGPFLDLIAQYVEDNEIERPTDMVIKSANASSKNKVKIIHQIDQQLPFEEIAKNLNLDRSEFIKEIETIIGSGTKLNFNYYLNQQLDEEVIDDIMDYFTEAESLSIEEAAAELEPEGYTFEEIELVRLKFYSDMAN